MIEVVIICIDMESAITVLNREELLLEHTPHSLQFQTLTEYLLLTLSSAAVVPPLTALEIQFYSMLALFHDIGKRAIPLAILNKPVSLTAEEFEVVKTHTIQGCRSWRNVRNCGSAGHSLSSAMFAVTTMSGGTVAGIRTD